MRGLLESDSKKRCMWGVAFALATFFAFPQPLPAGLSFGRSEIVLDFGFGFGWLAAACWFLSLDGLSVRRAAKYGFGLGLGTYSLFLYWIYVVTVRYGGAPPFVGVFTPVGGALYFAFFTTLCAASWRWLAVRGCDNAFCAALLWVVFEHLRTFVFTGFPWALLGYSQHHNFALVTWAPWIGVLGISCIVALGGAALAEVMQGLTGSVSQVRIRRSAAMSLFCVGSILVAGALRVLFFEKAPAGADAAETLRVAIAQGNIDQGDKWSPEWADRTLQIYEELTWQARAAGAEVVLWPETAVPGPLLPDTIMTERVTRLARETGLTLVVGAVAFEFADAAADPLVFDSAYMVRSDGEIVERYDKSHLVPFGEYLPFRKLLGGFITAIARGAAFADVTAGPEPKPMSVPLVPTPTPALTVGVPICYELIFPDLVRQFVRQGGRALFALTNDAWYGRSGAPYQFLAITALRSAETGVWTARAANTGVSAFIDPRGRIVQRTPLFERALLVYDLPLRDTEKSYTFYVRFGDWFAGACWVILLSLVVVAWRRQGTGTKND